MIHSRYIRYSIILSGLIITGFHRSDGVTLSTRLFADPLPDVKPDISKYASCLLISRFPIRHLTKGNGQVWGQQIPCPRKLHICCGRESNAVPPELNAKCNFKAIGMRIIFWNPTPNRIQFKAFHVTKRSTYGNRLPVTKLDFEVDRAELM